MCFTLKPDFRFISLHSHREITCKPGKKIYINVYLLRQRERKNVVKAKFIFNKRTPHPHHNILIINYRMLVH